MDEGEIKSFFLVAIYCLALGTSTLAKKGDDSSKSEDGDDYEANICKCMKGTRQTNNCCKNNKIEIKGIGQFKKCTSPLYHCECDSYELAGTSTLANGKADSSKLQDGDDYEANICKCMKGTRQTNNCCKNNKIDEQTGVSVGLAVGLLFLGVAVGIIVTALICVFVPSLHRKTDTMRRKVTRRFHNNLREERYQTPQELDDSVTDNRMDKETAIGNPKVPTAPVSLPGLDQDGYQVLDAVKRTRISHAYTGLQSKTFGQYGGDGGGQSPEIQPVKLPKAIISPVYREFTDNTVPSNERKTKQNAYNENQNSKEESQPIRNMITSDTANHAYFVLEPQNEAKNVNACDNERPASDHSYFVLEAQNA